MRKAVSRPVSTRAGSGLPPGLDALLLSLIPLMVSLAALANVDASRSMVRMAVLAYTFVVFGLLAKTLFTSQRRRVGWAVLLAAHAFWFALPACVNALVPGLWFGDWIGVTIGDEPLLVAAALVSLFLLSSGATYWLVPAVRRPSSPRGGRRPVVARNDLLLSGLVLLGLLPYLAYAATGSGVSVVTLMLMGRADKPWRYETFYGADSTNMIFWLSQASLVAAGSMAALGAIFAPGRFRKVVNAFVAFVTTSIVFLDQGTRSLTAMLLLPPALIWLLRSPTRVSRRILVFGPVLMLALLMITQFYLRTDRDRSELYTKSIAEILVPKQHNDFFTETALAVSIVRDSSDLIRESPEWITITNVIPRSLWSGKPVPETFWRYSFYRWGRNVFLTGGNALPSVVGQYYMNWGWPGVLWAGALFGVCFAILERIAARTGNEPYLMLAPFSGMIFFFVAFRYFGPGFHYIPGFLSLIWLVGTRVTSVRAVNPRVGAVRWHERRLTAAGAAQ